MTTQSLRQRREERERKARELQRLLELAARRRLAGGIANPVQRTVQPSVNPAILSGAQQQFDAAQSAERTAFTPLGQIDVGTNTAAVDTRGKPEFGGFPGSGVLENIVGSALPALENFQKGLETVGGAVVGTAGALTPGDLFGFEENLRQIKQEGVGERGGAAGFWDWAGQAQELAKAFRETDMPSTQVTLPGGGIPLPGDRRIEDIDVGVKGAIELVPEIVVGIATGGTSAVGGIGRRTGISIANALAYDVGKLAVKGGVKAVKGGKKVVKKGFTVAPSVAKRARERVNGVPKYDWDQDLRNVEAVNDPAFRQRINGEGKDAWPTLFKGPLTAFWSAVSPIKIADLSRASVKGIYTYVKGLDKINIKRDLAMSDLVQKIGINRIPKKVKGVVTGVIEKTPNIPYVYTSKGIVQGSGFENIDGVPWTELHENFFIPVKTGADGRVEARHIWGVGDIGVWDATGGPNSAGAYVPRGVDVMPVLRDVRAASGFNPDAAELATFIRHYQNSVKGGEIHYLANGGTFKFGSVKVTDPETGEVFIEQLTGPILDYETSIYNPRNARTGTNLNRDVDEINGAVDLGQQTPRTPGTKPSALKERSITNDVMKEQIALGNYELMGPMETLGEHHRAMYKATLDLRLTKFLKAEAGKKGSGLFNITEAINLTRRHIRSVKKGTKIKNETLDKIAGEAGDGPNRGFPQIAKALREARDIEDATKRAAKIDDITKGFDQEIINLNGQYYVPSKGKGGISALEIEERNRIPAYAGLLFESKKEADRVASLSGLKATGKVQNVAKWAAEIGDLLRLGRTGFDFGYHLLQGMPQLGLAAATMVLNPKAGLAMSRGWGESVMTVYRAARDENYMMGWYAKNIDVIDEATGFGMQMGRTASDVYAATGGAGTVLRDIPRVGDFLDKWVGKISAPFERGFISPSDVQRVSFYKAMRPSAVLKGEDGLRQLAAAANNMTGALSSQALGIGPNLQRIERGFLFFSPRYTRAAIALLGDMFRGNIQGQVARRSLIGMVGVGMTGYIATVEAMQAAGSDQEIHLDPANSDFMTIDIGNDRIGLGGIWTSLAKLSSRTLETAWDEDARETWLGDETVRSNPLIRWIRSRSAPFAGGWWDVAVGEDFLGRPIEGPRDWTEHLLTQTTPIWFEASVLANPYRTGAPGFIGEMLGARVRELSSSERRADLRNELATQVYGKKWVDLNGLERDKINESPDSVGVTVADQEELAQLTDRVFSERSESGAIEDVTIEKYRARHIDIDLEWNENVATGIDFLDAGAIDLRNFRQYYLQQSNAIRRQSLEELNAPDGDFALAIEHFAENATRFGEDNPEDVGYSEYITTIVATDAFDDPEGFDFDRQQKAIVEFQQKWGDEVFAYVQQRFREGRAIPEIVSEFWQGRKRFEYYWGGVDEAVIAATSLPAVAQANHQQWLDGTENEKKVLEETVPGLKALLKRMSNVRASLRKQDQILDAWLFRWGFTKTLDHPDNEFAPDGVDDAREYWRTPIPFPLQTFGIESGIAL